MTRGDIYIARLKGSGSVQNGVRPVVVIQNDIGNEHSPTTVVASITKQQKKIIQPTHFLLEYRENVSGMVLCEQLYTINKSKLTKCIGHLSDNELNLLNQALCVSIGIDYPPKKKGN